MSVIRNSIYVSFIENYSITLLQFIGSIVIARLLTPSEIGVFSIAVLLSGLAGTVRDFGVTQYLIQEKDLTDGKIRAAMALSIGIAWFLAVVLLLLSGPVARFYREPGIAGAVIVLASTFLLVPFGSVVMAMLRRELRYWAIFRIRVGSTLVATTLSIALAMHGFGYMSLAWSALGGVVATILLCGLHRPAGLPRLPSISQVPQVFSFSGPVVLTRVISELSRAIPELAVGKAQTMESVGLLGRALGLRAIQDKVLMSALWSVVLPYFSKLERERGNLRTSYARVQAYVTGVAWPMLAFLAGAASPIIAVLYGPQWDASAPPLRILCVAGMVASALPFFSAVLLARGRADAPLKMQLLCAPFRLVAVVVSAPFGLLAVSSALVAASLLDLAVCYGYLRRLAEVDWRDLLDGSARSIGVTIASGIGPAWFGGSIAPVDLSPIVALLAASATAALGWLAAIYLFKHPVRQEIAVVARRLRDRA
ncbi:MAG TPA: lipopolysaccharide biosynthesis protein [Casimicrobiaceae bacterium]|nr:lipopolysaccharide biosynthesis protein [Casimicrobiaceae bacterium]